MLKIEVIKFEAQDVITASTPAVQCTCSRVLHQDANGAWNHDNCPLAGVIDDEAHNCHNYEDGYIA